MNYMDENKAAWEEAFDNRRPNWGDNNHERLKSERFAFFNADMKRELESIDFNGKTVAQFCCNNGRELLSLMDSGASIGIGFDIAENIIEQARETAKNAGIDNCTFIACNILDIPESYHNQFDLIFLTVGAITWFEDLSLLFAKVSECLKVSEMFLINEIHPMMGMLPIPGEECYNPNDLNRIVYSYFRKELWLENSGMGYMSVQYKSKTFTSFSHTMGGIINALGVNGLNTVKLNEYNYDIGIAPVYDGKGFPLSFILVAEKGVNGYA